MDNRDNRLTRTNSQYRMWRDSHSVNIPAGESTTRPLTPETIPCNVESYGDINKGIFNKPDVLFSNSDVNKKYFDYFKLDIYRDADNIANIIDLNDDIITITDFLNRTGLERIDILGKLSFENTFYTINDITLFGGVNFNTSLIMLENNKLISNIIFLEHISSPYIGGNFYISTEPIYRYYKYFDKISDFSDDLYINFNELYIETGNSKIDLLREENIFSSTNLINEPGLSSKIYVRGAR